MVRRIDARTPDGIILVESTQVSKPHRFIGVIERSFGEEADEYAQEHGQGVWCPLAARYRAAETLPPGVPSDWVDQWAALADRHVGDPYSYAQMVLEAYNSLV